MLTVSRPVPSLPELVRAGRSARRRGGARIVTAGFLGVGGSAFVLLAAGARVLSGTAYSGLGLLWTISTLFGIGLAAPTEQLINRRMNAGAPQPVTVPALSLAGLGVLAALASWLAGAQAGESRALSALPACAVLAIVGWTAAAVVRGRLAGVGDLSVYGVILGVEGGTRLLLTALAVAFPDAGGLLLPLAVGVPLLVSAAAGCLTRVPSAGGRGVGPGSEPVALPGVPAEPELATASTASTGSTGSASGSAVEQIAFVLISLGYQVCLNAAPLLLEWGSGAVPAATVGAFVTANTYFRTPALLTGGVLTHALVRLSHAWGARDAAAFTTARRAAVRQALLLLLPSAGALLLATPFALTAYYGRPIGLPVAVLVALAASTVIAVVAAVAVQPMLACGRSGLAGAMWVGAAVVTCGVLQLADGVDGWTAAGLLAGPCLVLAGAAVALRRLGSVFPTEQGRAR